jgi:hypothetical protein
MCSSPIDSPAVDARRKSFDNAIHQILWPETRRPTNIKYQTASGKRLAGLIGTTGETSYLRIPKGFLPDFVQPFLEPLPWSNVFTEDGLQLGSIPKGKPVGLIASLDLDQREDPFENAKHKLDVINLLFKLRRGR